MTPATSTRVDSYVSMPVATASTVGIRGSAGFARQRVSDHWRHVRAGERPIVRQGTDLKIALDHKPNVAKRAGARPLSVIAATRAARLTDE